MPNSVMTPFQLLSAKLKRLRSALRIWNKEVFGRLDINIHHASLQLQQVQVEISSQGFSEDLHRKEINAHADLDLCLKQQEIFFKE